MTKKESTKRDLIGNFLLIVEKLGNALPHPATLFALLAIAVVIMSWIASLIGFTADHPSTAN
jgi:aminobenzoyl-glutamate transport protein